MGVLLIEEGGLDRAQLPKLRKGRRPAHRGVEKRERGGEAAAGQAWEQVRAAAAVAARSR